MGPHLDFLAMTLSPAGVFVQQQGGTLVSLWRGNRLLILAKKGVVGTSYPASPVTGQIEMWGKEIRHPLDGLSPPTSIRVAAFRGRQRTLVTVDIYDDGFLEPRPVIVVDTPLELLGPEPVNQSL